jgi:hypothetical protein
LGLLEFFEAHRFKARMVEKQVLISSGVDKTETPVRQSLDRTFSHLVQLPERVSLRRCPNQRAQVALPRDWYCIEREHDK